MAWLSPGNQPIVQLVRSQLLQPSFNPRELAPVKVMLEDTDHRLDVSANPAEFADRPLAGALVGGSCLHLTQSQSGARQGGGNLVGVGGYPAPALRIEAAKDTEPAMDRLGEGKKTAGVVGYGQGNARRN